MLRFHLNQSQTTVLGVWTVLVWFGLDWAGLDWSVLVWQVLPEQKKQGLVREIQAQREPEAISLRN